MLLYFQQCIGAFVGMAEFLLPTLFMAHSLYSFSPFHSPPRIKPKTLLSLSSLVLRTTASRGLVFLLESLGGDWRSVLMQ